MFMYIRWIAEKEYSVSEAINKTMAKASPHQEKLAVKLLTYILIFSSFVTIATSSYIIYLDYLRGTKELNQSIIQIEAGYQESISYSLWNFDSQQINTQLAGILNFPSVLNVYIETKEGLLYSTGDFEHLSSKQHAFDLSFTNAEQQYPLGVLSINLDYQGLYETLFYKALDIIASQFIRTFSVSLFILFIFQRLVTHRLLSMSEWASRFNLSNLDHKLSIIPSSTSDKEDEIDAVVNAINTMRVSLKNDIKKREITELALKKSQHKLSIAINNADLGFCEYNQKTSRFSGNEHFSKHLGTTHELLEKLENPIDWFNNNIVGEHATEQQERINHLLHGHRERIFTELSFHCGRHSIKHFYTTIQVSQWDDDGLPLTIIFCILDKTAQVNASRQAADLNHTSEQTFTNRIQQLNHQQVQSQMEIKKLQQQLDNFEQQQRWLQNQDSLRPLQQVLSQLQDLIHPSKSNSDDGAGQRQTQQAKRLIELLSKHLQASNPSSSETFDAVVLIQESLQEFLTKFKFTPSPKLRLPFSLMLDSHKDILTHCFEHCLITIATLNHVNFNSKNLMISLGLDNDYGVIELTYNNAVVSSVNDDDKRHPASNEMAILRMCHAIFKERLDGSISVNREDNLFKLTLRFSINPRIH
jgi:PAS domain-containing protein